MNVNGRHKGNPLWSGTVHPHEPTHVLLSETIAFALQERANELCTSDATSSNSAHPDKKESATGKAAGHHGKGYLHFNLFAHHHHNSNHTVSGPSSLEGCGLFRETNGSAVAAAVMPEPMVQHPWFNPGRGEWARRLDETLVARAHDGKVLTIGLATGLISTGMVGPKVQPWPNIVAEETGGMVRIVYLTPEATFRASPYAFNSSVQLAQLLEEQATAASALFDGVDIFIVDLGSSDATSNLRGRMTIEASKKIVKAYGNLSSTHDGTAALIYVELPYLASNANEAQQHANAVNGAVLTRNPQVANPYFGEYFLDASANSELAQPSFARYLCARMTNHYYNMNTTDVHAWHAQATVRSGVPIISYRAAVWPVIGSPPLCCEYWSPTGHHQPQLVHHRIASYVLLALQQRFHETTGCGGSSHDNSNDNAVKKLVPYMRPRAENADEESIAACSNERLTWLSVYEGQFATTISDGTSSTKSGWKFYEDRPGMS